MIQKIYPEIDVYGYSNLSRVVDSVEQPPIQYATSRYSKSTNGTRSPKWPEVPVENSFFSQELSWQKQPGWIRYDNYGKLTTTFDWTECPLLLAPPYVKIETQAQAIRKMYGEISEVTANLALLYAERAKTGESIAIALGGILKAVKQVRRGKCPEIFMGASELAGRKKLSGAWLNYVYGIKPLCQDLHAIACSEIKLLQRIKGRQVNWWEYKHADPTVHGAGTYRATYNYAVSLKDPLYATLAGAGLTNPALIAWELTPFSFMADWLLPVGPYLEMLSSTSGLEKHSGSFTETEIISAYKTSSMLGSSAYHRINRYKLKRRTTTTFPDPPLPSFKNPFSPVHALNFLTIIHQFVKEPARRAR